MTQPSRSWLGELVEATRRVVAFGTGTGSSTGTATRPKKKTRKRNAGRKAVNKGIQKRSAEVRKLAASGIDRLEISRRTRLSQDTVGMLLNLEASESADSAGEGTFFRTLQTRIAA